MSFLERNVRPQLVLYVQGFLLEVDAPAAFTRKPLPSFDCFPCNNPRYQQPRH